MTNAELALVNSVDDTATDERRGQKSDTAYRTISEVATDMGLPQHVLRFWETKFKQISPLKRGGGRRYYRPQDVDLIKRIHYLLHTQGYTIKGVQKLLVKDRQLQQNVPTLLEGENAREVVAEVIQRTTANTERTIIPSPSGRSTDLMQLLDKLKEMRSHIDEQI